MQIGMDLSSIGLSIAAGRIIAEFSDVLDHFKAVVEREERSSLALIDRRCAEDVAAIQASYSKLRASCVQQYSDLKLAIDTAKHEAKTNGNAAERPYSPSTLALMQASGHLLAKEADVLPVTAMMQEAVSIRVADPGPALGFASLLQAWKLGNCTCERCTRLWQGLLTTKQAFDMEAKVKAEISQAVKKEEEERLAKEQKEAQELAKIRAQQELQESEKTLRVNVQTQSVKIEELQQQLKAERELTGELKAKTEAQSAELEQIKASFERGPPPPWWGRHHHGPPPDCPPGEGSPPHGPWGHHGGRRRHHWG